MNRIPGQPNKKRKYLNDLDAKQLPFLIGDILFFIYNHTEIKVLDGPGDGKRDISSKTPEGKACITQCKFHNDFKTSVSSRETDEIAIALLKFKTTKGIFATTGKLSPQAKREFINDFPDFELSFFEGTDIVDMILSSPTLTSVWVKNESIKLTSKTFVIPFILRDLIEDKPLKKVNFEKLKIISNNLSIDYFHPYRVPQKSSHVDTDSDTFLNCYHYVYKRPVHIHEIQLLIEGIFDKIIPFLQKLNRPISIRIGTSFFAKIIDDEFKEKLKLEIEPKTYIVSENKKLTEKEYVLPLEISNCIFPKRFGSLESPWAAWYFSNHNLCLQVELSIPYNIRNNFFHKGIKDIHLQKINESLFFFITKKQFIELGNIIQEINMPDWVCEYGFEDKIIGWLHPYLLDDDDFRAMKVEDEKYVLIEDEIKLKLFKNKIQVLNKKSLDANFLICKPNEAIHLSKRTNNPLFIEPKIKTYDSAHLFHYFDELPSPLYIKNRIFNFIYIWTVPSYNFNPKIVEYINQVKINSKFELNINFDIRTTYQKTNKYARLDLTYQVPENYSSTNFLNEILQEVISLKNTFENKLKNKYSDAVLGTEFFWNKEIGIYFK